HRIIEQLGLLLMAPVDLTLEEALEAPAKVIEGQTVAHSRAMILTRSGSCADGPARRGCVGADLASRGERLAVRGAVPISVADGAESSCLSECSSKGGGVVVAGGATNLVDGFAGRLEEALGVTHADLLEVGLRPVSGGCGEPAIERADAQPELRGQ